MPTCLDSFGLGGVLAYLFTYKRDTIFKQLDKNSYLFLSLALYIGYIVALKMDVHHGFTYVVLDRLFGSILSFFLILRAVSGFGGIMKFCLENPVTTYIGRISYGLYLYHNFVYNFYHTNYQRIRRFEFYINYNNLPLPSHIDLPLSSWCMLRLLFW
jgi:peptidoglycan/LPS O-acetylase OafA/YrhL